MNTFIRQIGYHLSINNLGPILTKQAVIIAIEIIKSGLRNPNTFETKKTRDAKIGPTKELYQKFCHCSIILK